MAEEEKKEEVTTEVAEEKKEEEKKEKKDNWFSKTFNKMKKGVEDANREGKLENEYRKDADELSLYNGGLLPKTYYGKVKDDNTCEVYGVIESNDVEFSSVLEVKEKFYYVTAVKHDDADKVDLTITEKVDDKEVKNTYSRPVTIFTLNPETTQVDVVKVKDKYFLKLKKDN